MTQNGVAKAVGYSGHGEGKNNPAMQSVHDVGPIPQGLWKMTALELETAEHGPYVIVLTPSPFTETFGRTGLLCHGDSVEHPGCASLGCVIMPHPVREEMWTSDDHFLKVIP